MFLLKMQPCTCVLSICKITSQFNGLIAIHTSTDQMPPTATRSWESQPAYSTVP